MKMKYRQAMEWLYLACVVLSGAALVAITLIIPAGVFMRYVMNNPMAWPEPAAVIMMVMFSFLGGAAVNTRITAEATPLHLGKTTHVWQTMIRNEAGKLCAVVTQTQLVLDAPA